jgi:lipopolysaccharide assembly outer membrane protein LptD (OstA)
MTRKRSAVLLLLLACCYQFLLWAQPAEGDATPLIESAGADTLLAKPAKEDSLFYAADSIAYHYEAERIYLSGNTNVRYQEFTISSDSLLIDLKKERAYSYGYTVMQDGEQILLGRDVAYDIDTQTGLMSAGVSRIEKGYYYGEDIRKIDKDIYDIEGATFTTCEHEEPDFWFSSRRLRIYRGDKIVGKPVIAWVNHLPVFYFPFMTIPIRRGRHPGFLIPEPGYNSVDGKFVRDISWYFPYQDYADLILSLDLREKTGWKAKLSTDYIVRYLFNGGLDAAYQKSVSSGQTVFDWSLKAIHHHELGEKATFDLNLDFVSNRRIWESSDLLDESLAQRLTSSVSYRKPLLSSYLNVGATYTEDLINDRVSVSLPSATFSLPSRPVYELFYKPERSPDAWWSNLNYSYGVRFDHTGQVNDPDRSLADLIWDNTFNLADSTWLNLHNAGLKQSLGLSYNWKLRGWLNLQQGLTYNEAWFDRDRNGDKWVRGNDYGAYASTNFNIYGIRNFRSGYIRSIRHIMTPSASLSYHPDFSSNSDLYSFGGISVNSAEEAASLSLALDHKWQLKYGSANKKINDVLSFSSRVSANLLKDDRKFGNLSHTLYFRPGSFALGDLRPKNSEIELKGVSLGYSSQFSFSQDPYLVSLGDWKFRNQYFSHSLSLTGSAPYKKYFSKPRNRIFEPYEAQDSLQAFSEGLAAGEGSENWKLALSQDIYGDASIFDPKSSSLRFDAAVKLTDNWSLAYSNYYNLKTSDLLSQSVKVSRSLHCWKLDISYSRRNEFWEYRVVLFNLALPDALKFQTHDTKRY